MRVLALVLAVSLATAVVASAARGRSEPSPMRLAFGPELDPNGLSRA